LLRNGVEPQQDLFFQELPVAAMSHRQMIPNSSPPVSTGSGASDPLSTEAEQESCPLFRICEQLIEQFREACCEEGDEKVVRRWLEGRIAGMFGFDRDRSILLADLAFELMHLKAHGRFQSSELEVGALISRVTNGWVEPGAN
jgi:hypothetical protein